MQSEIESIKRLKNPKSKVSCHFLINRKGEIILMVKESLLHGTPENLDGKILRILTIVQLESN